MTPLAILVLVIASASFIGFVLMLVIGNKVNNRRRSSIIHLTADKTEHMTIWDNTSPKTGIETMCSVFTAVFGGTWAIATLVFILLLRG